MEFLGEELKLLEKLNINDDNHGGLIFKNNGYLYKILTSIDFFYDEIIRNIDFQMNNYIPNTPKVRDKIYIDGRCSGYVMDYIKNAFTFKEAIEKRIEIDNKIKAIIDIYKPLKYLHSRGICLGDIHLENALINRNGDGYLIDLDYLIFPGDEFKFSKKYLIRLNNKSNRINRESAYVDNIKAMICSLSLILGNNLENYINNYSYDINLESIYNDVISNVGIRYLDKYFTRLMQGENVYYFDDVFVSNYYKYRVYNKSKVLKLSK